MKSLLIIYQILLLTSLSVAQYKPYNTFNKAEELQKFVERGGKVEEISKDIYKLTYRTGVSRTFYLNTIKNIYANSNPVDTTIINVWEIDTTKSADMFKYWQQVEVADLWWLLPIEDFNHNGRPELYGYTDYLNTALPRLNIFERDLNGIYENIFTYDSSTNFVIGLGDIYGTGSKELCMMAMDEVSASFTYPVYTYDSATALPTKLDFFFYFDSSQINDMAFGDWDNNDVTDCAFINIPVSIPTMSVIAEFRDSINNFEEITRFQNFGGDISGFAIDDFDKDGKTELVFSSVYGEIFVIESKAEHEYSIVNQFQFNDYNAYMHTVTNDIDGNGRPEFWIGAQKFLSGITVFQCYEAVNDNNYRSVARIELRYLVSLYNYYIQAVDIDDDGKEELIISIGNVILILKFVGTSGNHQYKLWYAKLGEATQPGAEFYPAAIADLDGDGKKDLLIPMEKYTPSVTYAFSYILKRNGTSGVNAMSHIRDSFESIRAYPNPFNPSTNIKFRISETGNVSIKIFNVLGKEIITLLEDYITPGKHTIKWYGNDDKGNILPGGVYFIQMIAGSYQKTIKTILLK